MHICRYADMQATDVVLNFVVVLLSFSLVLSFVLFSPVLLV